MTLRTLLRTLPLLSLLLVFSTSGALADSPFKKSPLSAPSGTLPSVGSIQNLPDTEYLPGDDAFRFSSQVLDEDTVMLHWAIANGYYLFRDELSFAIVGADGETTELADITLPPAEQHYDDVLGDYEAYSGELALPITLIPDGAEEITLQVGYQGCAASGFCYPPMTRQVSVDLSAIGSAGEAEEIFLSDLAPAAGATSAPAMVSEQDAISNLLADKKLIWILLSFFGFGLLLTFTPCVLPMIPILSGIIAGQGEGLTTRKAFILSLVYVLAMALTYAGAGMIAGMAGTTIQASLQSPIVIIVFSILFVLLALSLFGFYELRLPNKLHQHLHRMSERQRGGTYIGVAIMGVLSALIVSPCVTAPLVGALAYISTTGNAALGGGALFALALGMGVPLLLIGTFEGKLIPKAGNWMETIKAIFGVLMLAVAIWMLERILPGPVLLLLWAGLLIVSAVYMGVLEPTPKSGWPRLWKGLGVIMLIYAVMLMIGASTGSSNPFQPLTSFSTTQQTSIEGCESASFTIVKSSDDLDRAIAAASAEGKTVFLDFYADWCASCIRMSRYTFTDPDVRRTLCGSVLLKADVTANDALDRELMQRFGVYAPPAMLFFGPDGEERRGYRLVGEMGPEEFEHHAARALAP